MLNENVKKLFKENMWNLATCAAGVPSVVPVAFKDVTDDGKLVVGDVFLDTTLRNLAANDGRIAISVYDAKTLEGYQIRGTAEHVTEGAVVTTFKAMVEQMFQGAAAAKGALIITPETVIVTTPGAENKRSCNGNFPSLFDPSLFARRGRGTRCAVRARFCTLASRARMRYAVGNKRRKGAIFMRIAVPYENGNIFQHFGRSEAFKFYDVDGDAVTAAAVVSTNGSGHGALAGFLVANHADVVICGGIGGGAQSALTEAGIRFYGGVSGSADAAVQALLDGSLGYDPEARCDHHDHAHGAGHTCGEHGCGEHSCHS